MTLTKKCVEEAVEKEIEVCVISGVEGNCLSINYRRVAGAKPWGGGKIITKWNVTVKDIIEAFPEILSLAQAYISGELGEMAEVTCPKCRDIGVICKDDPAKAYVCDCQVGKQWKIEPRGAQFRRVEEQQKMIERYRSALEKIVQFKCVDHEFVWEAERDFLKIIDITTTALKGQNGQEV